MTRKAIPCSICDASLREPSEFYFLANVFLVVGYSAHRWWLGEGVQFDIKGVGDSGRAHYRKGNSFCSDFQSTSLINLLRFSTVFLLRFIEQQILLRAMYLYLYFKSKINNNDGSSSRFVYTSYFTSLLALMVVSFLKTIFFQTDSLLSFCNHNWNKFYFNLLCFSVFNLIISPMENCNMYNKRSSSIIRFEIHITP